jgi:hypothetical protein
MHNTHVYGTCPADFTVGQRVATHPASGAFMKGMRFGEVIGVGRTRVKVRMDIGQRVIFFGPGYLAHMADQQD